MLQRALLQNGIQQNRLLIARKDSAVARTDNRWTTRVSGEEVIVPAGRRGVPAKIRNAIAPDTAGSQGMDDDLSKAQPLITATETSTSP